MKQLNYSQTLDYLFSRLPIFQRIGAPAYKPGLERTLDLCKQLGNPQNKIKTIHVAGTNGKGSTSHMLASVLQEAGYKTGLYTSPHLKDFRERIKINGHMIEECDVVDFVEKNRPFFEEINPSFFEVTAVMAFWYFEKEKVDIAVIETGMGGRLDSTNVITPLISVITNIGLDHTQFLGDTIAKIAEEKAGIIKANIPVIIGETHAESTPVFNQKAKEQHAPLYFADQLIANAPYECELKGIYQQKNIKTVLQSFTILKDLGYKIEEQDIRQGIKKVVTNTQILGRWQTLGENPKIICDTGHNEDGIREVLKGIQALPFKHLHIVFGMVNDKDGSKILKMLPKKASYYFCKPNIVRGKEADLLQQEAAAFELHGNTYDSVQEALLAAKKSASKNDLIFVGGSTFVVAEVV